VVRRYCSPSHSISHLLTRFLFLSLAFSSSHSLSLPLTKFLSLYLSPLTFFIFNRKFPAPSHSVCSHARHAPEDQQSCTRMMVTPPFTLPTRLLLGPLPATPKYYSPLSNSFLLHLFSLPFYFICSLYLFTLPVLLTFLLCLFSLPTVAFYLLPYLLLYLLTS
jgi:hypothetical protein